MKEESESVVCKKIYLCALSTTVYMLLCVVSGAAVYNNKPTSPSALGSV